MNKTIQNLLILWGLIAFFVAILFLGFTVYSFSHSSATKRNSASPGDVTFILKTAGINQAQSFKVLNSFQSGTAMNGNHLDAYELELTSIESNGTNAIPWESSPSEFLFLEALRRGGDLARGRELSWLPSGIQGSDTNFLYQFPKIVSSGRTVVAAQIIALERHNKRLFFLSFKD